MFRPQQLLGFFALFFGTLAWADLNYQIGSEWGKKPVDIENLSQQSPVFQRTALATANIRGATSFYLGYFNGEQVMATNHHVMPYPSACRVSKINFSIQNVEAPCKQFLGSWARIDLTLFTIKLNEEQVAALGNVGRNFAFHAPILPKQELLTIGFGIANNPEQKMVANQDSDCKVFSRQDEFRLMADPDEFNPGEYKAWSFSIGCEGSHGDSGSAIVDRQNGNVIGIIWTGKTPKSRRIQNSAYLEKIFLEQHEDVWTELAYAVPASKMYEVLQSELETGTIDPKASQTIKALLAN